MKDAEQGRYEIGIDHRDSMEVEGRSFLIYRAHGWLKTLPCVPKLSMQITSLCCLSKSNFIELGALLSHLRNLENEIKYTGNL